MDNIVKKVFYIVSLLLIVAATAYQVVVLYQGGGDDVDSGILNGYFYVTYVAFSLAVLLALVFPIISMVSNPKGAIRTFIGIGIVAVLWFISSAFSGNTYSPEQLELMKIDAETSVMVGTGLIYTYIIFGLAIMSIIYAGISGLFK
ncbi:MAG: hypothetical protein KAH25_06140 [Bacteroidales bacterium]|nr:hypothetical protein [Bacteroidales bacterium]